jgi:hypothetical protein
MFVEPWQRPVKNCYLSVESQHIQISVPRLSQNHPLTLAELKEYQSDRLGLMASLWIHLVVGLWGMSKLHIVCENPLKLTTARKMHTIVLRQQRQEKFEKGSTSCKGRLYIAEIAELYWYRWCNTTMLRELLVDSWSMLDLSIYKGTLYLCLCDTQAVLLISVVHS